MIYDIRGWMGLNEVEAPRTRAQLGAGRDGYLILA